MLYSMNKLIGKAACSGNSAIYDLWYDKLNFTTKKGKSLNMDFFQKNKSVITILLMVSFFLAILLIFVSGATGSKSHPTPTSNVLSQQSTLATSTNNLTPSTPKSAGSQVKNTPLTTAVGSGQTPTIAGPKEGGSPPPTLQSSTTSVSPGTNAPPPPTFQSSVTEMSPGTDAPPPPTLQSQPTEPPPPGNGPPPGS